MSRGAESAARPRRGARVSSKKRWPKCHRREPRGRCPAATSRPSRSGSFAADAPHFVADGCCRDSARWTRKPVYAAFPHASDGPCEQSPILRHRPFKASSQAFSHHTRSRRRDFFGAASARPSVDAAGGRKLDDRHLRGAEDVAASSPRRRGRLLGFVHEIAVHGEAVAEAETEAPRRCHCWPRRKPALRPGRRKLDRSTDRRSRRRSQRMQRHSSLAAPVADESSFHHRLLRAVLQASHSAPVTFGFFDDDGR